MFTRLLGLTIKSQFLTNILNLGVKELWKSIKKIR